jgi:hypothetical protein
MRIDMVCKDCLKFSAKSSSIRKNNIYSPLADEALGETNAPKSKFRSFLSP